MGIWRTRYAALRRGLRSCVWRVLFVLARKSAAGVAAPKKFRPPPRSSSKMARGEEGGRKDWQPRANTSMRIMRAPQRGHRHGSTRGVSGPTSGCCWRSAAGGATSRSARAVLGQDEKVSTYYSATVREVALKVFAGIGVHGSLEGEARGGADDCHFPAGSRVVRIALLRMRAVLCFGLHCIGAAWGLVGLWQLPLIAVS
jgi:hypothetical protein